MITIRKAKPDDWIEIANVIGKEFHSEIFENIPEMMEVYSKLKSVLYNMRMAENGVPFVTYLAFDGDELVGGICGRIQTHRWMKTVWGEEEYWFVKKEYRNGKDNIGTKLFERLMKWFEAGDVEKIRMTRFTFAEQLDAFYKKKGFVPFEIAYVKDVKEF
tara:strand:+ start:190 stop:669 length:480 start_codon:yes stop_codon:yes gene_type:complete